MDGKRGKRPSNLIGDRSATGRMLIGGGLLGALAIAVGGHLIAKRQRILSACSEFYANAKRRMIIPGLRDGFDPQDLFYVDSANAWLFSGYHSKSNDERISPIYRIDESGKVAKVVIELPGGSIYRGHGAAICATEKHAFLTVKDGYVVMSLQTLLDAKDGEVVKAFAHVPVELEPAFMNIQDGVLYIGEFYHKVFYETPKSHWVKCPNGETNQALMYAYDASVSPDAVFGFEPQPDRAYSIPAEVQGMCVASEGRMVLSKSWGFGVSQLLVYKAGADDQDSRSDVRPSYLVAGKEVPLIILDSAILERTMTIPPMSEGIVTHDGEVWISNESASSLYNIGKLIGGKYVYSIEV